MSEYQYYEFQAVDRLLTASEQEAVNALSSHITVSASHAVVTYAWGDFKHDPRKVVLQYFDAFLYYANWGTQRLMFRFPHGLLNSAELEPYLLEDSLTFETGRKYDLLEVNLNDEGGGWGGGFVEASLADFVQLRADMMEGDYRCLYLAWLKALELTGEADEAELVAAVPPGLKKLTPALRKWVDFIALDEYALKSAAASSAPFTAPTPDWGAAVAQLTRAECDAFLTRLVVGESGIAAELRQRLQPHRPTPQRQTLTHRSAAQVFAEAETLWAEAKRRAAATAEATRIKKLQELATRAGLFWTQVEASIAAGKPKEYDNALAALKQLAELAVYQNSWEAFLRRVRALAEQYKNRSALLKRFRAQRWL